MRYVTLALVLLIVVGGTAVSAQTETPTATADESPFQVITVGGYEYRVDPFFPCVSFIIERTTRLDPTLGPTTTIVMLDFHRNIAGDMVPDDPRPTTENELTATAEVGQAWTCGPQEAVDGENLDG